MTSEAPPKHAAPQRRRRRYPFLRLLGFLFTFGFVLFLAGASVVAYMFWRVLDGLPDYEVLARYEPAVMTRIHANNGSLIKEYAQERRVYLPLSAMPERLIHAFLSAEDKNFYSHVGIDLQGLVRAVVVNLKNLGTGRRAIGASTITQQVAKNFLLSSDRTIERKLKEAILSIRIEQAFTKQQILELYLNEIYLGLKSYGVAAAALNYWGKSLHELSIAEVAYLAALPKAPNNYHPFKRTAKAIERRNWVIDRMVQNGYVSAEEAAAAKEQGLEVNPRPFGAHVFAAEFFTEEVRRQLYAMYGEKKLYTGGLSVRTTLDPGLQRAARRALIAGLVRYDRSRGWRGPVKQIAVTDDWGIELGEIGVPEDIDPWRLAVVLQSAQEQAIIGLRPPRLASGRRSTDLELGTVTLENMKWAGPTRWKKAKSVDATLRRGDVVYVAPAEDEQGRPVGGQWRLMQRPEIEGALVAMDPHTGQVAAMVGGFSFAGSQFNRVTQARRQPGSAFKPIIYTAALDNGYSPASAVLDAPMAIEQGPGLPVWRPMNYDKKFHGLSTLRVGIEKSRNLMTVRLAKDMGMPLVAEYARRFGIYDNLRPMLSMALGAGETTLLKMTTAYAMLVNGGKKIDATLIDRIQDRYGRIVWRRDARDCIGCDAEAWRGQEEPLLSDDREEVVDRHSAYQMTSMLEGVVRRGTGRKILAVGKPLAGKTGTTNDYRDAWFVGFSPDLAVGVFIGHDTPKSMGRKGTGGGVAAPIFRDFMKMALAGETAIPFRIPPGVKLIRINSKTGRRARAGSKHAIMEAFKPGTGPRQAAPGNAGPAKAATGPAPGGLY